jgi:outer membrane immunogenic protein
MKRVLLATVGVLALATASASAADLPVRGAYPTKAPAYVAQVYNWTGFYLGAHVGWGRVDLDSTVIAPAGLGTVGDSQSGFLGGGQVGFNYQIGQFVIGVEGDIAWTDIGRTSTVTGGGVTITESTNVDWIATLAGRLGYAFGPALLYVKGGVAWMDWSSRVTATGALVGTATGGNTETGYVLGAGLEYAFTPNWSAKLEYNYLDFGTERTTAGGLIVDTDLTTHVVKAGVNYRF